MKEIDMAINRLEDCPQSCLDTCSKKLSRFFDILPTKKAKINAWNKVKLDRKTLIFFRHKLK